VVRDLEALTLRVWNPDVRPFIDEALRCHGAGAQRAAVVTTWGAVVIDLVEKIERLASDGNGTAIAVANRIDQCRRLGSANPESIRQMQDIESGLLAVAENLEILDPIERALLERLREDRHRCAHPGLLRDGGFYRPSDELARAHLTAALDSLLCQPPLQGKAAVKRLEAYLTDANFTSTPEYFVESYFRPCGAATQRQIAQLITKTAICGPSSDETGVEGRTLALRAASCLDAIAQADRLVAMDALEKLLPDRFAALDVQGQLECVARLGHMSLFWDALTEPTRVRIHAMVGQTELAILGDAGVLALADQPAAQPYLPDFRGRIALLDPVERYQVLALCPSPLAVDYAAAVLKDARSYRGAETAFANIVLPAGLFLKLDQLQEVLTAWAENDQCVFASAMPDNAVHLYQATRSLLPESWPVWNSFCQIVSEQPGHRTDSSYYTYPDLAGLVQTDTPS
jgi:hypothetical protein